MLNTRSSDNPIAYLYRRIGGLIALSIDPAQATLVTMVLVITIDILCRPIIFITKVVCTRKVSLGASVKVPKASSADVLDWYGVVTGAPD